MAGPTEWRFALTTRGVAAMTQSNPSRRDFLQTAAAGVAVSGVAGSALAENTTNEGGVPLRPLGQLVVIVCVDILFILLIQ